MSCIAAQDTQLARLADAIAQRVGQQRFHVWFNNSTRLDLHQDALEIAVPNDFISEWIGSHFSRPIQEAAHEVLGCSLPVRFSVVPELFETRRHGGASADDYAPAPADGKSNGHDGHNGHNGHSNGDGNGVAHPAIPPVERSVQVFRAPPAPIMRPAPPVAPRAASSHSTQMRLRHDIDTFVVGASNQLAYNAAVYVAEFPGAQYNPLFIHGSCGLGKTHLLQGLCRRFIHHHPTKRWGYMTGEEFTNEFLTALRTNKVETFRRKMRDMDLLVIDDVHFLGGKKATQEEFLHTFNAIEANGRQVVMASDNHPRMIQEFGESLVNRFVSGMVVRIDPPNHMMRCEILRAQALRGGLHLPDEVVNWIARRVTNNVRELEGAMTRIAAHVKLTGRPADLELATSALGDLDRHMVAPLRPDNILNAICGYFSLPMNDLMSGRRQRNVSLARSIAMYLIRRTAKLSYPEIGLRMGKRNHSTVISACRRIERAVEQNQRMDWSSPIGPRDEEAAELVQRLEELSRSAA